jgi:HAD superfamily phosphoserine phosphatase-like hydrolase
MHLSPKLVILDVDGTLTAVSSPWRYVHEYLGVWDNAGKAIARRWLSGEIDYDTFCELDLDLWRPNKADYTTVSRVLDAIPILPQAIDVLRIIHGYGAAIALISTGFERIALRISQEAGLNDSIRIIANKLYPGVDGFARAEIRVSNYAGSGRSKGDHVLILCDELCISPTQCIGVGDGPSDRHLFDICGQHLLVERGDDLYKIVRFFS